eukprot:290709_1
MSSLFKRSFHSKQLKEFTDLSLKAIPCMDRDTAKSIYKSIKNKTNKEWTSIETALDCLQQKLNLNVQISVYKNIINNKRKDNKRRQALVIKSAKSHLSKLLTNSDTIKLINSLENGFNLSKNSLIKTSIPQYKIPSSPLHRKRKRANTGTDTKTFFKNNNKLNNRKRSDTLPLSDNSDIKSSSNINTTEQLNFYLERALTNKLWNDNDANILCKTAINMKCNWITIHSLWVPKCKELLHKHSVLKYKNDLK